MGAAAPKGPRHTKVPQRSAKQAEIGELSSLRENSELRLVGRTNRAGGVEEKQLKGCGMDNLPNIKINYGLNKRGLNHILSSAAASRVAMPAIPRFSRIRSYRTSQSERG